MIKSILLSIFAYVATTVTVIYLSASSEEYNTVFWKFLIGQIYAIPMALIFFTVFFVVHKEKQKKNGEKS